MWLFRLFLLLLLLTSLASSQRGVWRFAVSGDSRNCGDIVVPAIAQGVVSDDVVFYWHLGDFRAIYRIDEDYAQAHKLDASGSVPGINEYLTNAWDDFVNQQIAAFGELPVFLSLGNHEIIPPKDHNQVLTQFADWLNSPVIRAQRRLDGDSDDSVKAYYHWTVGGVDFISLDNSLNTFEDAQMQWLHALLNRDAKDFSIREIVVGMHEALPDSISADHSMNQSPEGTANGRIASDWLVRFKVETRKPVYVLASHSHFYMEGIFNTPQWLTRAAALPGWIVGTAGAVRYPLPPAAGDAKDARTKVYGYLLATVDPTQREPIHFEFHQLTEADVPKTVVDTYSKELVDWCWNQNYQP